MKIIRRHYIIIIIFTGLFLGVAFSPAKTFALSSGSPVSSVSSTSSSSHSWDQTSTPPTSPSDTYQDDSPAPNTPTLSSNSSAQYNDYSNSPHGPPSSYYNNQTSSSSNTNVSITSSNTSSAQTGSTVVSGNTTAGNATSGNATDVVNQVNSVTSTSNLGTGGSVQTSTDNIDGNVNGDIDINPADLGGTSTTNSSTPAAPIDTDSQVNNNVDVTNNLHLGATTGDATVSGNTTAGNATSGDALTEANIINLLDSTITDSSSFIDVININGNLNGNILIPADYLDGLVGAPTPVVTDLTTDNNLSINNLVTMAATTGNATVSGNTTAGNAKTGNATNNLNIYNLINSQIVGGNLLLVFVNVSGNWVGYLLNEPIGTTEATLGGQIEQYQDDVPPVVVTNNTTEQINNNINLSSSSGNALVSNNTTAGNATSGNASNNANLVNILGSNIDLSGWLGILVINVLGNWTGSLGIILPVVTTTSSTTTVVTTTTTYYTVSSSVLRCKFGVYSFNFYHHKSAGSIVASSGTQPPSSNSLNKFKKAIAASTNNSNKPDGLKTKSLADVWLVVVGLFTCAALIVADRMVISSRRSS